MKLSARVSFYSGILALAASLALGLSAIRISAGAVEDAAASLTNQAERGNAIGAIQDSAQGKTEIPSLAGTSEVAEARAGTIFPPSEASRKMPGQRAEELNQITRQSAPIVCRRIMPGLGEAYAF